MSNFFNILYAIFVFIGRILSRFGKKITAKLGLETVQYDMQRQQIEKYKLQKTFEDDYCDFADRLKMCLESNHSRLGVACPKHLEDLFCDDLKRVDAKSLPNGNYSNITFSFEIKREPSNVNLSAISSGTFDYVPIDEIKRQLVMELPKYRGDFFFNNLSVFPMPDRKVKVVVQGVDRPPKQPYWGDLLY